MAEPDGDSRRNPMADLVGPFYAADSAAGLLGCDVTDLSERAGAGILLEVHTGDGVAIYPTFQFTLSGAMRPEIIPVLIALKDVPRWSAAVWLLTANHALDGETPEQALNDPAQAPLVHTLAQHWAYDVTR